MDNGDIKRLLGNRIKELRKKLGITQEQLAELVEIDQRNLSNIECGITFPSKSLASIAHSLGIPLKDLFDFEHSDLSVSEMKEVIADSLDKLEDRDILTVFRLIKSML